MIVMADEATPAHSYRSNFTFIRKYSFHSFLLSYGEEVKAKNEKQRACATHALWGLRWEAGALSKKASGSWSGTAGVG